MASTLLPAIHHVALICSDYARSKAFYSETLGFRVIREVYRAERDSWKLDLEVSPGVSLELFSFPLPPPRPSRPEAQGLRHLAFSVPDIDRVIATLTERGVTCEPVRVDEFTDRRFTFFADPDGLPIELYEA
ncbi:VOC family protein [Dyella sp. C11]|uniref:SMU1112c/YaeR family gloxylase I-like metalloprotein n=1 Tax=Dyella sp. C11 TaxID=2126991 RepID=UPI0018E56FE5|nr:VOC family protein [Dyella sp. C11]